MNLIPPAQYPNVLVCSDIDSGEVQLDAAER
jgi:hypothetical protein